MIHLPPVPARLLVGGANPSSYRICPVQKPKEEPDTNTDQQRKFKAKKVCQLIPKEFQEGKDHYSGLLQVVDFVAGMTDSFALTLFRRLKGVTIPR